MRKCAYHASESNLLSHHNTYLMYHTFHRALTGSARECKKKKPSETRVLELEKEDSKVRVN